MRNSYHINITIRYLTGYRSQRILSIIYSMYKDQYPHLDKRRKPNPNVKYDLDNPTRFADVSETFLPTRNKRTPEIALREDKKSGTITDSLGFYNGNKFTPQKWKIQSFFKIQCRLNTLKRFYPDHPMISSTDKQYHSTKSKYYGAALATTLISWYAIFQFARRGKILPVFRQYGRFFGTHRVFRQYLYTAVLPITLAWYASNSYIAHHVNHLWSIHAKRLNNGILDDAMGSTQPQLSPNFRVNIYKSVIPQEIDLQEQANAKLSLAELGDDGISDFEIEKFEEQAAGGEEGEGAAAGGEGESEGEGQGQGQESDQLKKAEEVAEDADLRTGAEPDSITSGQYIKELGEPVQHQDEDKRREQLDTESAQQLQITKKNVLSQDQPDMEETPVAVPKKNATKSKAAKTESRGEPKKKKKLSELDLDSIDIDTIDIDELDLEELGLQDASVDDASYKKQNKARA